MSAEENKELGRRFIENGYQEVMRGNLDAVHEYFADNYHDHTSLHPEQSGVGGVKELIADAGQASPDLRWRSWISPPTRTLSSCTGKRLAGMRNSTR
jgi:hypothetical protein